MRTRVGWLAASGVVWSVACGGTAFVAGDSGGPGSDGSSPVESGTHDGGTKHPEAGARDATGQDVTTGHEASTADASDAHPSPDVVEMHEASTRDVTTPSDAQQDVVTPKDTGVDTGVDSGFDAGPPCMSKTTNGKDGIAIFLVPGASTASTCGSRNMPCGDLPSAVSALKATAGRTTIFVGSGSYTQASTVALPDGITIRGGWTVSGSTWTATCDASATPTFSSAAQTTLTIGSAGSPSQGKVTLDTVNVVNTFSAGVAQSVYGIVAVGTSQSSLVLNDVGITVPAGGAGAAGTTGTTGATGNSGGCAPALSQGPGLPGGAGPTGSYSSGGFTAGGSTPATIAQVGGLGGTPAVQGPLSTGPVSISCTPPQLAGQSCVDGPTFNQMTGTTNSGCGGHGGSGGSSGSGGGASIALFLWDEAATISAGTLKSGSGGSGGSGGGGGAGGAGAAGGPLGSSANWVTNCGSKNPCTYTKDSLAAPNGLQGNPGAPGGAGGGGAGGDSYAYYRGPSATPSTVTLLNSPVLVPGAAGAGGAPGGAGAPSGPAGYSGNTNTQD